MWEEGRGGRRMKFKWEQEGKKDSQCPPDLTWQTFCCLQNWREMGGKERQRRKKEERLK